MAAKPALIAAAVAGTLALGTAGYFANEWRVCRGLEDDFLATIGGYTANVQSSALAAAVGTGVDRDKQKELQDLSLRVQRMQLTYIYDRCGKAAGKRAASLAGETLQDRMEGILALP